jgi:hypothetical protein
MRKTILVAAVGAVASYLRSDKGRATLRQLSRKMRGAQPATSTP